MKNTMFLLLAIISFGSVKAQTLQVTYSEKMDLSEQLEGQSPLIKQMILDKIGKPKIFSLISKEGVSLYHEVVGESIDNGVSVIGGGGSTIFYKNLPKNRSIKQIDFMSRKFLITDSLDKRQWNIKSDTLKIGGFLCTKATTSVGDNIVEAWFSNEIPVNEGPRDFYGLPGLILKIKKGNLTIQATLVEFTKEDVEIKPPSKGKAVTQSEFDEIRNKKIDQMTGGQKPTGSGVKVIKM